MNDGRRFTPMFLRSGKPGFVNGLSQVILNMPCMYKEDENFPKEWISIFEATYTYDAIVYRSYLVSYDAGLNWKMIPFPNYRPRILNNGGIIFGISFSNNTIIYSFDEGNTYYSADIFEEEELFLGIVRIGFLQKEYITIIAATVKNHTWVFTQTNFSNILSDYVVNIRIYMSKRRLHFLERS
ncbi:hypothetical protein RF11_08657 [Thelohanellus kitauei]|uniref:Sortilin N-terminal domain-containing protein n=1 Tax=Thelohanellus kitauei TaxID=669202 RepID=A0A0C2N7D6_THEKT|nr:hypothetical protein RF11_08657 [Thelohanellus kitauei]